MVADSQFQGLPLVEDLEHTKVFTVLIPQIFKPISNIINEEKGTVKSFGGLKRHGTCTARCTLKSDLVYP